jgi:hypothetical protein
MNHRALAVCFCLRLQLRRPRKVGNPAPLHRPSAAFATKVLLRMHVGFYTLHPPVQSHSDYPMQPMQSDSGSYHSQGSAFGSIHEYSAAGVAPIGMLGTLQLPQAAGTGNWQPLQQHAIPYPLPSGPPANPAPYLRQGVAVSLASSSSSIRQKLELPPLPRPLSSTVAALQADTELKTEFKPSVCDTHTPSSNRLPAPNDARCAASTPTTASCA